MAATEVVMVVHGGVTGGSGVGAGCRGGDEDDGGVDGSVVVKEWTLYSGQDEGDDGLRVGDGGSRHRGEHRRLRLALCDEESESESARSDFDLRRRRNRRLDRRCNLVRRRSSRR